MLYFFLSFFTTEIWHESNTQKNTKHSTDKKINFELV
jgi:hypothetical protein